MKALVISGDTLQQTDWNVEDILNDIPQTTKDMVERLEFQERYINRQEWYYNHALSLNER
jgi:dolichyl-phosphate-mannose--protein O-mannosyl transferase